MSVLFVKEQGSKIGIEGGHYVVKQKELILQKLSKEKEAITVFGNVVITTQCVRECLIRGVPINYFSTNGSYFGKLTSTKHAKANRLKKQVYVTDQVEFRLKMSKTVIHAKISNQIVLLKRYIRDKECDISEQLQRMNISKNKIEQCNTIDEIMGYEGNAAKEYFLALSKIIQPEFAFQGRSKQPPRDPFNSMLSLGYTILMYEIYAEIENKGLTPYIGFLHADHANHPTLASDLMEEWRPVIVDAVVMSLIQGHEIQIEHFLQEEDGVYLTAEGMKIFISKLEKKFRSNANYLCSGAKASFFRRGIYLQVAALARAFDSENIEEYIPMYIR